MYDNPINLDINEATFQRSATQSLIQRNSSFTELLRQLRRSTFKTKRSFQVIRQKNQEIKVNTP